MGTVTSSMTEAELDAAFHTYCNYIENNSTSDAAAFISVCTAMLSRASSTGKGTFSASWNKEVIYNLLLDARRWLEARDTTYRAGPTARDASFRQLRGQF